MQNWLVFLRQTGAVAGVPLVVGGICLMFFGWRMWKVCVMLAFGAIGAAVGAHFGKPTGNAELYAIPAAILFAGLSYWPVNLALALLGGVVGGGTTFFFLSGIGVSGLVAWGLCGAAVFSTGAYAFLHRQHIVVFLTALMGALLLTSGIAAWLVALPSVYSTLTGLASHTTIVAPFLLLVPTAASCFFQLAEIRRHETSI